MVKVFCALFVLCFFPLCSTAANITICITSAHDLAQVSVNVSHGTSYSGTTLLVINDLDFSNEKFAPIGTGSSDHFTGVFNGQGHVIRNLVMNVSKGYVGLFGYSWGTTIRNIILDPSCSITSTYDSFETKSGSYVGSVIGYCEEEDSSCVIDGNVNMGNVTFSGGEGSNLYLGGITGYLSSRHELLIKNCANYGSVTFSGSGSSNLYAYVGGIIGYFSGGSLSEKCTLQNSLNLGALTGKCNSVEMMFVGGIVGAGKHNSIENCVNAGTFSTSNISSVYVGSLAGYFSHSSYSYFYCDSAIHYEIYGRSVSAVPSESIFFNTSSDNPSKLSKVSSFGEQDLSVALNAAVDKYALRDYSPWMVNWDRKKITFSINSRESPINMDYPIVLLPSLVNGKTLWFDGWYIDSNKTILFDKFSNVTRTAFYGTWAKNYNRYTISYKTNGGTNVDSMSGQYGEVVQLNESTAKEGCMFAWWEDDYGSRVSSDFTVPAHDVTLYAVWDCDTINGIKDFIDFVGFVNSGTNYNGKTVYLGADIDFNGTKIDLIGYCLTDDDDCKTFLGTFDGQGYTISNYNIQTSSTQYVGLFGYSEGATIRNVVMDGSCSVVNSYKASFEQDAHVYTGGIIGFCKTYSGPCIVENSVNIANVSFWGETNNNLYVGGIVGLFTGYSSHSISVKNCVNYGPISNSGKSGKYSDVGGIVGGCDGNSNHASIENCLNYGVITHKGETNYPCIGGFAGYNRYTNVNNCVNAGIIESDKEGKRIGSITGEVRSSTLSYCYYTSTNDYDAIGKITSSDVKSTLEFFNNTFELSSSVSVGNYTGKSLFSALNAYVASGSDCNHSNWASNLGSNNVSFVINDRESLLITVNSQIILFPDVAETEKMEFEGWYTDPECTSKLDKYEITSNIKLYGKLKKTDLGESDKNLDFGVLLSIVFSCALFAVVVVVVTLVVVAKVNVRVKANKEIQELLDPLVFDVLGNSLDEMSSLYPEGYERPSLKKALMYAGIGIDVAGEIAAKCYEYAESSHELGRLPKGVTVDDAAAIALYTMETKALKKNPYSMINEALMNGDLESLKPVKELLYLVMSALRKMPIVYGRPLYRGIRSDVVGLKAVDGSSAMASVAGGNNGSSMSSSSEDDDGSDHGMFERQEASGRGISSFGNDYMEGEEILWLALSSTSPDVAVTKEFLAKCSASGKAEGTLFIIEGGWGYNVQPCSMYPREEEIVLEPERRFRVKTVIPGEKLTIIKMEMLKTPIVLPDVFGKKVFKLF